jgi:hypothetical protein
MNTNQQSETPLLADLDLPGLDLWGESPVQTTKQPTASVLRREAKERFTRGMKRETLKALIPTPPAAGECIHVISNGRFDYFTFIPLILDWIGKADCLYGSTWTMNRANVTDLLKYFDDGKIRQISIASGNYFLKRESAVAATILQGLRDRGQRFTCWENHAKIILLNNAAADAWYAVEGSANWTANPRTEQNILLNDKATWNFHRDWLEEMFSTGEKCNG